jgi:hypothetical protein
VSDNEISGFFSVETPSSVRRKVDLLAAAWKSLQSSYPSSPVVKSEVAQYLTWQSQVESSVWNQVFASSVAPEYETWLARYKSAYQSAKNAFPTVSPTAPVPEDLAEPELAASPWFWAVLAGTGVVGLWAIASIVKSR